MSVLRSKINGPGAGCRCAGVAAFWVLYALLAVGAPAAAQEYAGDQFSFVRIRWTDNGIRYGYTFSTNAELWAHDYPRAEKHLNVAIKAATNIKVSEKYEVLTFADEEIFRYPFIYACEIGYLTMSEAEVANLREYLRRGGFLMVDDFRFPMEMRNWMREIRRVLPHASLRRLPDNHPIFHCFFDLSDIRKPTPFLEGLPPEYYGIFDEHGRMMVLVNYNNDIGDGWEWPEDTPNFSTEAFKLGINYLIYSYSH